MLAAAVHLSHKHHQKRNAPDCLQLHLPGVCLSPQTAFLVCCFSKSCFPSLPGTHSTHSLGSAKGRVLQ